MSKIKITIDLDVNDKTVAKHIKEAVANPDWPVYVHGDAQTLPDALSDFFIEALAPDDSNEALYHRWNDMDWLTGSSVTVTWGRTQS